MFNKTEISFNRQVKLGRIFCCGLFLFSFVFVISQAAQADTALKFEKSTVYGDTLDQAGNAVELSEGRLYIAGSESAATMKALAVGYDAPPAGDPLFSFRWQSDANLLSTEIFTDVAVTADSLYFTGQSWSTKTKQSWPFLVKFSNQGKSQSGAHVWLARPQLFEKNQEGAFYAALLVQEETGTAIYVTGYASSQPTNRTAILAKYDLSGNLLWSKKLSDQGERSRGAGLSLAAQDGSIYVGGYTDSGEEKGDVDNIPLYATLWKYDASGKEIWRKQEADSRLHFMKSEAKDVKVDLVAFENFLYIAAARKKGDAADVFLLKYDQDGTQLWTAAWDAKSVAGGARAGFPAGLAADKDRLFVAGWTGSPAKKGASPNEDAFLLEVDKEYGFVLAVHERGESAQQERALGVQTNGTDVYLVGSQRAPASKGKAAQSDLTLFQYKVQPITNVKIEIQSETKKPAKKDKEEKQEKKASKISVTILSSGNFNPSKDINTKSLTFGRSGHEPSWDSCAIKDANSDGILDLVCYFEPQFKLQKVQRDIFLKGDDKGILRGDTVSGTPFAGKAKLVPGKPDPDPVVVEVPVPTATALEVPVSAPLISAEEPVQPAPVETSSTTTLQEPVSEPVTSTEVLIQPSPTEPPPAETLQAPVSAPLILTETSVSPSQFETAPTATLQTPLTTSSPVVAATITAPATTSTTSTTVTTTATAPKNITSLQTPTLISAPYRTTAVAQPVSLKPVPPAAPPAVAVPVAGAPTAVEGISAPADTLRVLRSLESPRYQKIGSSPTQKSQGSVLSSGPDAVLGSSPDPVLGSDQDPSAASEPGSGLTQAYNDMGQEALKSGKAQEAVAYFQEALKLDPKSVEAHTYVGLALAKAGKLEEAREHLLEAARLKPDDEDLQKQLQAVLDQLEEQKNLTDPGDGP